MTLVLKRRDPVIARSGTVFYDAWHGFRVVGAVWNWRKHPGHPLYWRAEATGSDGSRLACSSSLGFRSELEARQWLTAWWGRHGGATWKPGSNGLVR